MDDKEFRSPLPIRLEPDADSSTSGAPLLPQIARIIRDHSLFLWLGLEVTGWFF